MAPFYFHCNKRDSILEKIHFPVENTLHTPWSWHNRKGIKIEEMSFNHPSMERREGL
jgi:hypothetical protein